MKHLEVLGSFKYNFQFINSNLGIVIIKQVIPSTVVLMGWTTSEEDVHSLHKLFPGTKSGTSLFQFFYNS